MTSVSTRRRSLSARSSSERPRPTLEVEFNPLPSAGSVSSQLAAPIRGCDVHCRVRDLRLRRALLQRVHPRPTLAARPEPARPQCRNDIRRCATSPATQLDRRVAVEHDQAWIDVTAPFAVSPAPGSGRAIAAPPSSQAARLLAVFMPSTGSGSCLVSPGIPAGPGRAPTVEFDLGQVREIRFDQFKEDLGLR